MENPFKLPTVIDLKRMFAYMQIRRWHTEIKSSDNEAEKKILEKKIERQAIIHNFDAVF